MKFKTVKLIQVLIPFTLLLAGCAHETSRQQTGWTLAADQSMLSFISTKNREIREEHTFTALSGSIDADRQALIEIDLDSVETQIEIRNRRMRNILFETEQYPKATVEALLQPEQMQSGRTRINLTLSLHGASHDYAAEVSVDRQSDRLVVTSYEPIEVNAKDFDLDDGINQLTRVAQLQGISYLTPVEFKLVFVPQP